jgi:hypothetical protein
MTRPLAVAFCGRDEDRRGGTVPIISRQSGVAALLFAVLSVVPAGAQDERPLEVFVGWAPVFADRVQYHVLPAWAVSMSGGGSGPVSPVLDISGWYFPGSTDTIHSFLAGPRYTFPGSNGVRGFTQVLAGPMAFLASGAAFGLALVPGGGADVPITGHRFAFRIQGDYFGMYIPGDYGHHYWSRVWRVSTGVVLPMK